MTLARGNAPQGPGLIAGEKTGAKGRERMGAAKLSERLGKVTVKEVAEAAGVSTASVSRVVNEHDNVAASTREAVLEAITRLNYMPHNAGRVLATRRSRLIGVILPDIYGEYFSELVRGIDQAAREHGLHLLVAGSHGDAAEASLKLQKKPPADEEG